MKKGKKQYLSLPPLTSSEVKKLAGNGQLRPSFFCDPYMAKVVANNAGR
jgi:hypothetical protein